VSQQRLPTRAPEPEPLVLVVDDDRRVRELLEIAFSAHGFKVITAADGEEAIRRSHGDRPDLVILDVRLPKRSGLEVCEMLRHEADDPSVPIILVSAAAEAETRLQGFSRGADDYLVKPFSPRELLARAKRLLARSQEQRAARRRLSEVERELTRANEESRRAHLDAEQAQKLSDLAVRLGSDLHRIHDLDALARRLALKVQEQLEAESVVLLTREPGGSLTPRATVGAEFERALGLAVRPESELSLLLHGLGRPVYRHALDRLPELEADLRPFVAGRFDLLAPVRGDSGLEAVIVVEEHHLGAEFARERVAGLEALCGVAALALANATREAARARGLLELVPDRAAPSPAQLEVAGLVMRAARTAGLAPRTGALIERAVALAPWALGARGATTLARLGVHDATGFVPDLVALCALVKAQASGPAEDGARTDEGAVALVLAGLEIAAARAAGLDLTHAVAQVLHESPTLPVSLRRALDRALEGAPEDVAITPVRKV